MNETKFSLRTKCLIYLALAYAASLISIGIRTVNLFYFFDTKPGYYVSGKTLPILEWVCLGVFAALLIAFSILWFRKQPLAYAKRTPILARIGAGAGVLGFGVLLYADVMLFLYGADAQATSGLIPVLLSLGAAAYFLLTALSIQNETLRLLTGFCVILRLISSLSTSYFNFFVPMNAPDKLIFQLGVLGGLLFLVNELRAVVASPRSVTYMLFAGLATVLLGTAALPSLLALFQGVLAHTGLTPTLVAMLGMYLAVALRFLSLAISPVPKQEECQETAAKASATEESAEEIAEEEAVAEDASIEAIKQAEPTESTEKEHTEESER